MPPSDRAGQPATPADLVDVPKLVTAYYAEHPDVGVPEQRVAFGTSGHRGSALSLSFNSDHIVATSQAICDYRAQAGTDGPLFLGRDTHALSEPAFVDALEVFAGQRGAGAGRLAGHVHADAGRLARDPHLQPRPDRRAGRRRRGDPVAQPAPGRRLQVQPAGRRPGRHRRDPVDPGPGERAARRRPQGRPPGDLRAGPRRRHHRQVRLHRRATSPTSARRSTSTRSARPASGSAPTRSAAPPCRTGGRSASATAWTSPWSTRSSTRPGGS